MHWVGLSLTPFRLGGVLRDPIHRLRGGTCDEPAINGDLTHNVKAPDDLTFELLRDEGWTFPDADSDSVPNDEDCNPNSNLSPTIVIGSINTGVPNTLFANGCTMAVLLAQLAAQHAGDHDAFMGAVSALTNQWHADGLISGRQKGKIQMLPRPFS